MAGTTVRSTGTLSVVADSVPWPVVLLGAPIGVESRTEDETTPVELTPEEAVSVGRLSPLLVGTIDEEVLERWIINDDGTMVSITVDVGVGAVAVVIEAPMHEHALLNRSLELQTAAQYGKPAIS